MADITIGFKEYKEYILKKPYGINIMFGQKGYGKTFLNTVFCLWEMAIKERYRCCISAIDKLSEEKGRKFSYPKQPHCVYTSKGYSVKNKWKYGRGELVSYRFDPYKFNLPNERIDYDIFPEYSTIHIMEGQAVFNSRDSKSFPDETSRAYENSRHASYLFYIDCQRLGLIDVNVRKITDIFICPLFQEHVFNSVGAMIKTITHTICFKTMAQAEAYETDDKKTNGILVDFVFEGGCIFNCYDSQSSKKLFYNTDKDFIYILSDDESIPISLLPPKNYRKKG